MGAGKILACAAIAAATLATAAVAAEGVRLDPFYSALLTTHNAERDRVGVPRLEWSAKLATDAQRWASLLAREGQLRHAGDEATGGQGENLWMGPAGRFGPDAMIQTFLAERKYFRPGTYPNVSTTGRGLDVGHYSQIVWRNTRQVGCAMARGQQMDFLVCRYWPAGNWRKQPVF